MLVKANCGAQSFYLCILEVAIFPDLEIPQLEAAIADSVELLAEGNAKSCYMAFGARTYPPLSVYAAFSHEGRCEPRAVASHLEKCPGCAVADDALFYFLFLEIVNKRRRSGPEDQRQALEEFRRSFWDGRDNTGLLMALRPGVSLDATWHKAVADIEAEFYGGRHGYYRRVFDRDPKALVSALRRSPDRRVCPRQAAPDGRVVNAPVHGAPTTGLPPVGLPTPDGAQGHASCAAPDPGDQGEARRTA